LAIWGEVTPGAILTQCGMLGDTVDVITCEIFGDCRLRAVSLVTGVILMHYLVDFALICTQNFVNVVGPWPVHVCRLWSGLAAVCRTYSGKSPNKWKQYSWHRDTLFNSASTTIKVFKLAWNQLCGFHNNSSDLTHLNSGFLGRLQTTYYRHGNKRVTKRLWGCVNAERQHSNTCCNFWYHKTFYDLDKTLNLFKRFNFFFMKLHKLWNDAQLGIAT